MTSCVAVPTKSKGRVVNSGNLNLTHFRIVWSTTIPTADNSRNFLKLPSSENITCLAKRKFKFSFA